MIATEMKKTIREGLVIFIILAAIFLAILGTDQDAYLAPALELFLLLYASFTGWSLFERERQEGAGEYMLSLPISRTRLLLVKLLPRALSAAALLTIYLLAQRSMTLPSLLPPADFAILYAAIFLVSLSFSVSLKNFISAFFLACLLTVGQVLLITLLDTSRDLSQAILQSSLTVLLFPLLFFILFQTYDVKPTAYFNRKFLPALLLLAGLIAIFTYFNAHIVWSNYYLTQNGLVLRNACRRSELIMENGVRRFPRCLLTLRESADGSHLYAVTQKPQKNKACSQLDIVRLDLKSGHLKTLYRIPPGWQICGHTLGEIGIIRDHTYSLLLQNPDLRQARLIAISDDRIDGTPINGHFEDPTIQYIVYPGGAQPRRRFLILSDTHLYWLSFDGHIDDVAAVDSMAVWQERILLFNNNGMTLYRLGETLDQLWQKPGKIRKVLRKVAGYETRRVLYKADRRFRLLDMETQSDDELSLPSTPFTYQTVGEDTFLVIAAGSQFTVFKLRPGQRTQTSWQPGFDPAGIRVSARGILTFNQQQYKVFTFNE